MPQPWIVWLAGLVAGLGAVLHLVGLFRRLNGPDVPPGPTQLPYLGRIHDLPIQYMWIKLKEWGDRYGGAHGFYRTQMLNCKVLVITDEAVAEDLLVKRAKYNSDRPLIRSLFDNKNSYKYLPLMGKNPTWARQRKLTHAYITEASNAQYHGVLYLESKRWLARLLANPDDFQASLEDMASKVMCTLCWDDPSVSEYCTTSAWGLLRQMSPGGPITNVITPLWHLPTPINPWKRAEHRRHDEQQAWWIERYREARRRTAAGELRGCWTRKFLEGMAEKGCFSGGEEEAASVLGMMALVGVFTVAGPLSYWLVAMVHHPRWQGAVQREVDAVCGGRLPTLEDAPRLPVLRACIKETMRWRPNVPTGVAHETEKDDMYKGFFIEKGTRLLPLDWAFLRNPAKYPDPDNFRPERWLEPAWPTFKAPLTQFPTIKGMSSFGWGQRQCLGMSVTQDEMLIACGALAWCFNLKPKLDETGRVIPVSSTKSNSLLIIKPDPFQMAFEPRNEKRRLEALAAWEEAEAADRKAREEFLEGPQQQPQPTNNTMPSISPDTVAATTAACSFMLAGNAITQSFMGVPALLVDFPPPSDVTHAVFARRLGRQWPIFWNMGNVFFRPISTLGIFGYGYAGYCAYRSATSGLSYGKDWRVFAVSTACHLITVLHSAINLQPINAKLDALRDPDTSMKDIGMAEYWARRWIKLNLLRLVMPVVAGSLALWQTLKRV
ncbi:cytochrome P450 [Podospora conica]|nr:cytochrome P450 [Schizothecium conicum]